MSDNISQSARSAEPSDADEEQVTELLLDAINNGASFADIQGISKDTMNDIYACAYSMYNKGQLDEAETFFRFLCIYDFRNVDYIIGLAAVNQLKKNYQKASELYGIAFALGDADYRPIFYTGQCQLYLRNIDLARQCFELVCEESKDQELTAKSQTYLNCLDTSASEQASKTESESKSE